MRGRLWVLVLAVAGLLLVGVVTFVIVRGRPDQLPEAGERPDAPANTAQPGADGGSEAEGPIEVSGTELTAREDGEVIWRASFEGEIEIDQQAERARAENALWWFEGEGFKDLSLEAPLMEADYGKKLLNFSRGVKIEAENGRMQFSAESVEYQFDTHKLIGSGAVRMRKGAFVLTGTRLVIDNATKKIRVSDGTLRKER